MMDASRSTALGSNGAAPASKQAPSETNASRQQECIDGMPLVRFWARVDDEKRTRIGPVLHGLRAHMLEYQRPCVCKLLYLQQ